MKQKIVTIAIIEILIAIIGIIALVSLPLDIGGPICLICFWGIRISIIVFALWFFWPYIKHGIQWLIDHREE